MTALSRDVRLITAEVPFLSATRRDCLHSSSPILMTHLASRRRPASLSKMLPCSLTIRKIARGETEAPDTAMYALTNAISLRAC